MSQSVLCAEITFIAALLFFFYSIGHHCNTIDRPTVCAVAV